MGYAAKHVIPPVLTGCHIQDFEDLCVGQVTTKCHLSRFIFNPPTAWNIIILTSICPCQKMRCQWLSNWKKLLVWMEILLVLGNTTVLGVTHIVSKQAALLKLMNLILLLLFLILLISLCRNYFKGNQCQSAESLKNKTVIVTGANSGIGREVSKDLARRGNVKRWPI